MTPRKDHVPATCAWCGVIRNSFWAGVVADQECPPDEAEANAELMAASRNALPALLRLARAAAIFSRDEVDDMEMLSVASDAAQQAQRDLGVEV